MISKGTLINKTEEEFQERCNSRNPRKSWWPNLNQIKSILKQIRFEKEYYKFFQVNLFEVKLEQNLHVNPIKDPKKSVDGECKADS